MFIVPTDGAESPVVAQSLPPPTAVLIAPTTETPSMAMVFEFLLPRLPAVIPILLVVAAALALHTGGALEHTFVAFIFTAFSVQYVLYREHVSSPRPLSASR